MVSCAISLECGIVNYAWGKPGSSGEAGRLWQANNTCKHDSESELVRLSECDESLPYAELWMGTHPTFPSRMLTYGGANEKNEKNDEKPPLSDIAQLPFLFKVLSVDHPLSLQSHPDRTNAQRLHALSPHLYPDANHKPEMAIALNEEGASALCSFRPWPRVLEQVRRVPSLADLIRRNINSLPDDVYASDDDAYRVRNALRDIMKIILRSVSEEVENVVSQAMTYLSDYSRVLNENETVFLMLATKFEKRDPGILLSLLLNVIHLRKDEALFIPPNEPHAYLSGDLIEIMACSDNVIRAGLTPKHVDVEELCATVSCIPTDPKDRVVKKKDACRDKTLSVWAPPSPEFTEFEVKRLKVIRDREQSVVTLDFEGPALLLTTEGTAELLVNNAATSSSSRFYVERGSVFYLCDISAVMNCDAAPTMTVWMATERDKGFVYVS